MKDKKWLLDELDKLNYVGKDFIEKSTLLGAFEALVKQLDEPKKVTVPKWFDEWMREIDETTSWGKSVKKNQLTYLCAINDHKMDKDKKTFVLNNFIKLAKAILDGYEDSYEVEKEQLYWVKMPINDHFSYMMKNKAEDSQHFGKIGFCSEEFKDRQSTHFTEEEITAIDKRYWAFAVEVEE